MTTIATSESTGNDDVPTRSGPGTGTPVPASAAPGSRLGPEGDFPEDLSELGMAALQVLHSRIVRQLDHDYLTDPAGPHPATIDRCSEVGAELDARDAA
jgi:hypothetical protein